MKFRFKVGDRVRVITKRHGRHQFGDVGVVHQHHQTEPDNEDSLPYIVLFEEGSYQAGRTNSYHANDLELITFSMEDTREYLSAVTGGLDV